MTRLSAARLEELYAGTLGLVGEHGFEKITMDQIAEATHSSKATLYRQWGSKTALVVEALRCATAPPPEDLPDTGSLRSDLLALVGQRVEGLERDGDLVGSILHALKSDTTLRRAVRDQVVTSVRDRLGAVVDRAVLRGEVAPDCPALRHVDLVLMAPFVLRTLVDDHPADDAYLTDYLDAVLLPALGVGTP